MLFYPARCKFCEQFHVSGILAVERPCRLRPHFGSSPPQKCGKAVASTSTLRHATGPAQRPRPERWPMAAAGARSSSAWSGAWSRASRAATRRRPHERGERVHDGGHFKKRPASNMVEFCKISDSANGAPCNGALLVIAHHSMVRSMYKHRHAHGARL